MVWTGKSYDEEDESFGVGLDSFFDVESHGGRSREEMQDN